MIGGRSIWGSLIDVLAEKYGWTLDYILWGVSFMNIQLMLGDCISTYYERSNADDKNSGLRVVNADDPDNYELTKTPDYGW